MKKLFVLALVLFASLSAYSQIEKSTILVGASSNAGFNSFNEDAGDFSQFNIDLKGGYFVMDNLAVGLILGFSNFDFGDSGKETDTQFGVFGRYYVNGKIFAGIGYTSSKAKFEVSGNTTESTVSTIPIELGYAAFLNDIIAIEPAINYNMYGSDGDGASFGLNIGITVYLGRGQ